MAMYGWTNPTQAESYIRAASRKRMGVVAGGHIVNAISPTIDRLGESDG